MEVFILEIVKELKAADVILKCLLASGRITDPAELMIL
jgi:hypothetical protein